MLNSIHKKDFNVRSRYYEVLFKAECCQMFKITPNSTGKAGACRERWDLLTDQAGPVVTS